MMPAAVGQSSAVARGQRDAVAGYDDRVLLELHREVAVAQEARAGDVGPRPRLDGAVAGREPGRGARADQVDGLAAVGVGVDGVVRDPHQRAGGRPARLVDGPDVVPGHVADAPPGVGEAPVQGRSGVGDRARVGGRSARDGGVEGARRAGAVRADRVHRDPRHACGDAAELGPPPAPGGAGGARLDRRVRGERAARAQRLALPGLQHVLVGHGLADRVGAADRLVGDRDSVLARRGLEAGDGGGPRVSRGFEVRGDRGGVERPRVERQLVVARAVQRRLGGAEGAARDRGQLRRLRIADRCAVQVGTQVRAVVGDHDVAPATVVQLTAVTGGEREAVIADHDRALTDLDGEVSVAQHAGTGVGGPHPGLDRARPCRQALRRPAEQARHRLALGVAPGLDRAIVVVGAERAPA